MTATFGITALLSTAAASAQTDGWWDPSGFSYGGFLRSEIALKTTSDENPFNLRGNPFNGREVERTGAGGTDTVSKTVPRADNDFNMTMLRGELEMSFRINDRLAFKSTARALYMVDEYENFNPGNVPNSDPVGTLQRRPNFFEYRVDSPAGLQTRESPHALEIAGENYMIDLPRFYLDYQTGPLNVRLGNQQIAWGQSLFFRVIDVPNGLDLRRHSVLDYVPEEFSDKRVPSPAVRATYYVGGWDIDAFAQHFRPTIFANPNTPYNVIPAQFTVHDMYGEVDDEINYGLRLRGPVGPFTVQFMAARRYNPDGTFRWRRSGVNRDLPGVPGSGTLLQDTAFEVDPTGVVSADEWFTYAGLTRLDAVDGLNASITEFQPATGALGAAPVQNEAQARVLLDTFFQASNGLRGHLAREYQRENVFGTGLSYRFDGASGSLLDQLIANIEVQYADNRSFTNITLSRDRIVEDEWTAALVLEKYQRFSAGFPSTFMVLQWLHKTESDIFGRHLSGMGGDVDDTARNTSTPSSANYVAFSVQQPFPNLTWRVDASVLYDVEGGLLFQPAIRYSPSREYSFDLFYNLVDGSLNGKKDTYNALSTADFADELTLRATYQF